MGHRANLILLGGADSYELFYTHWRANTLDGDLFWGFERAIAFVRRQRSAAEGAYEGIADLARRCGKPVEGRPRSRQAWWLDQAGCPRASRNG